MSVDVDFNKHSEFVWEYTVFLFSYLFLDVFKTYLCAGTFYEKENIAGRFISIFLFTDDVLALNDSKFVDYVDRIYPIELEIKETT